MKTNKILASVLAACLLITAAGCSDTANNDNGTETTAEKGSETMPQNSEKNSEQNTEKTDVSESEEETKDIKEIMESLNNGAVIDETSGKVYKTERNSNPISPNVFCADPTSVEYEGRIYVYGTNDTQQAENDTVNDYDQIKSLVCFSTDDMANWVYHGRINVGEIAPWIINSWAPSIASRVEDDGLTHFYLYFSNSGAGVGVITSTSPTGPWSDPLGKPLVYQNMPGLTNCPAPFDPGVCIDENGVGWLTFGGGASGETVHSTIPKIAKLGEDMLSFDSEFVSIDVPYFFEASELNYIDGTYYYTYNTDWQTRGEGWDYEGMPKPPTCSMAYLTTKTPLDPDSWQYRGAYFYNSGENADGQSGMRWGNNHTHFQEYQGVNYIFHHTMLLEELSGGTAGFRSMMADYLPMDAKTYDIPITAATRKGVSQIKLLDPYKENSGATIFTAAEISYEQLSDSSTAVKSDAKGSWIYVRGADFGYGADEFIASVKGKGRIEVRLDDIESAAVASIDFDNSDYAKVKSTDFTAFDGRNHNVYFVFSEGVSMESWQFTKSEETQRAEEPIENVEQEYKIMVISAQAENPGPSFNAMLEITKDGDYSIKSSSFAPESEILNIGFINTDPEAEYKVFVKSLSLETADGIVEIPVEQELDPASASDNGLANGWKPAEIGDVIYGSEEKGIFAAETDIDWIGYRLALKINGEEVPFTSVVYNITISGFSG